MSAGPEIRVTFSGDTAGLKQAAREAQDAIGQIGGRIDRVADTVERQGSRMESAVSRTVSRVGQYMAGMFAVDGAVRFTTLVKDSIIAVDRYQSSLKAASSSTESYQSYLDALNQTSARHGQNVLALGKEFTLLAGATRGTNLEGEKTIHMMRAISATSTALQLDTNATKLTIKAFSDMVSKGTVSMEELRRQLGNHVPGALKLAADAMGVTTDRLIEMIKNGEVLAEDLLPKLADEMLKVYGPQAQENARNLGNQINYATGEFKSFLGEFAKESGVAGFFSGMASDVGGLFNNLRKVNQELGALSAISYGASFLLPPGFTDGGENARELMRRQAAAAGKRNATPLIGRGFRLDGEMRPGGQYLPTTALVGPAVKGSLDEGKKLREEAERIAREANRQANEELSIKKKLVELAASIREQNQRIEEASKKLRATYEMEVEKIKGPAYQRSQFDHFLPEFKNPNAPKLPGIAIPTYDNSQERAAFEAEEFDKALNERLVGAIYQGAEGLGYAFGQLMSGIEDGGESMRVAMKGIAASMLDSISAMLFSVNPVLGIVAKLFGGIIRGFGSEKPVRQRIPRMATGAVVYGSSIVNVGEYAGARNNPEVIAPLNKLKSILGDTGFGGGGNMTISSVRVSGSDLLMVIENAKRAQKSFQ